PRMIRAICRDQDSECVRLLGHSRPPMPPSADDPARSVSTCKAEALPDQVMSASPSTCPSDNLPELAGTRSLPKYGGESVCLFATGHCCLSVTQGRRCAA